MKSMIKLKERKSGCIIWNERDRQRYLDRQKKTREKKTPTEVQRSYKTCRNDCIQSWDLKKKVHTF